MYMSINKEIARKLTELEIENRKHVLTLYDGIIETVNKFNGKVLNKRFNTALKKVDEHLSYLTNYNSFDIKYYCINDSVRGEEDRNGYRSTYYIKERTLYLNSYLTLNNTYKEETDILNEEGKLIADRIVKGLEDRKKKIKEDIVKLEESLLHIEEYMETIEKMKKAFEDYMDNIPYLTKKYFDIDYSIKKY